MSGGTNITNTQTKIGALQVSQSSQGVPITLLWGTNRVPVNLLWFDDFAAIEQRDSQQQGKGGGTTVTNVTYTYRASVLLGVCAGVCNGIGAIWRNKDKITATTTTYPAESNLMLAAVVPPGKTVAVDNAGRWSGTVSVLAYSASAEDFVPITDYTAAAGVYTFGSTIAVNTDVRIYYNLGATSVSSTAPQTAGFTWFAGGAVGQSSWGYLSTAHPDQTLAYSGVCHIAASNWLLGGAAGLPTLTAEVQGPRQVGGGVLDANPADILADLLTSSTWGAGLPSGQFGSYAQYSAWCAAAGLYLSPAWTERKGVFEYVARLAELTHARPLWSVDTLTLVPLATATLGGYTPLPEHAGPVYSITDDDIPEPIREERVAPVDIYNRLSVSYKDRANDYAQSVESAEDPASIAAHGLMETPDVLDATAEVATQAVAALVAELRLREGLSSTARYSFRLPIVYDLLEPLDIIQIQDARIGLGPLPVRITKITETGDDGALDIEAEDVQITGAVTQARQPNEGYGYASTPPGAVEVRAVMMPTAYTGGVNQLWVGVAAGDNWGGSDIWVSSDGTSNYRRMATVNVRSRMGTLASSIASASAELQPSQVLDVLNTGSSQLGSVSQADLDALRSVVWVNGELLAYRDATLTAANRYSLSYLRRGIYSTSASAHSTGAPWLRADDSVVRWNVADADLGSTIWLKVTSRSATGSYIQGLDEVAAIPVTLTPSPSPPGAVPALSLTTPFVSTYFDINWGTADRATDYEVQITSTASGAVMRTVYTSARSLRYLHADAMDDGYALRDYTINVRGRNPGGNGPWSTLSVSNPAPAAITGVDASGTGTSRTASWSASTATDLAGYTARYSTSSGFDPTAGGGTEFYTGPSTSAVLAGLTVGTTYYVRVAAFDVWDSNVSYLNWSSPISFTA